MAFNLLTSVTKRYVSSFFNRRSGSELWNSVYGVSPHGKKKGRGRHAGRFRDLNRGQHIGDGPIRAVLPGFHTAPLTREGQTFKDRPEYLPPDPNRLTRILEKQRDIRRKRRKTLHPLVRGWSGIRPMGRKLGWPMVDAASPTADLSNPLREEVTEQLRQFQTVCVSMRRETVMKTHGRTVEITVVVCVGNGEGLAGYGSAVAKDPQSAIRDATAVAVKSLCFIERLDNRTIHQDFFAECRGTRLFARRVPEGHGLVCHRVLIAICQLVGLKDIYIKTVHNTGDYDAIARAFFHALANQETHQQLAEKTRLLVVEFRPELSYLPTVVAAPKKAPCRTEEELKKNEIFDVDDYYAGNRFPWAKGKTPPFYEFLDSWARKLWLEHPFRNEMQTKLRLMSEGVVEDLTFPARERASAEMHKKVMSGEKPLPIGLGLSEVVLREDWNADKAQ